MPRKIRQLISDLNKAGFTLTHQVGSHRKYEKNGKKITLSGGNGDDAKPYQEQQIKAVIKQAK